MTTIVRAILTFNNPSKYEFFKLNNLIWSGHSLTEQQIYIATPSTKLIHYSSNRLENIKLSRYFSVNDISEEQIKVFKKEFKENCCYKNNVEIK